MDRAKFFTALEALLELDPAALTGDELLTDLAGWDSMAVVGFIAMVDETFGLIVPANQLMQCRTTGDLAKTVELCQSGGSGKQIR